MSQMRGLGQAQVMTYEEMLAAQEKKRQAALQAAKEARREQREEQGLFLNLLAQSSGTITEISPPINGDFVEADYKAAFTNTANNPVRVQVFADFTNPGVGAILSLTRDGSDVGKFDQLSLTANGRTESISIVLLPTYSLWVRDLDAAFFPMQGNDILRVRIFDPSKLFSYGQLFNNPYQK